MSLTWLSDREAPITLSGSKQHLRVDVTDDDVLIESLTTAGQEYIEDVTGVALTSGTLLHTRNTLADAMELPRAPILSIESVVLIDENDVETTVTGTVYDLDTTATPNKVVRRIDQDWPSVDLKKAGGVKITTVAGYGDPEDVPETLKAALKLFVSNFYEIREPVVIGSTASEVPFSVKALLANYKIYFKGDE